VAGYSSEEGQLLSQEETKLVLSKKNPVALFLVNLPKKTSYDHLIYSIRTDDEALDMDHVGLDIFG
jgi:hypothetical protein